MKKSAFWASDQATRKPARLCLEISDLDSIAIILSRQRRKTKALIRLCGCAGWSASLLFAYGIKQVFSWRGSSEPPHDKTNKMTVRPAKTQISLGIRPVWSESSLCAQWIGKDPSFLHADSENSDQTGGMPRLIRVFAGRTCHFVGFIVRRLNYVSRILVTRVMTLFSQRGVDWIIKIHEHLRTGDSNKISFLLLGISEI